MFDMLVGTVQGSIQGPILYAIFVLPVFDLEQMFAFADDMFILRMGTDVCVAVELMEIYKIQLDWLNKPYLACKIECKKIFLTH
jgi:hypothetical protein